MEKEWLVAEYWTKGKSCVDIAKDVGKDPKTVWYWMKKHGIETRPRGHNSEVQFKKGHSIRLGIKHTEETKLKISKSSKGRKPYLRNGKHWLHDKDSINPNWKGGITPERQALYNSVEWSDAIKIVWKRDNATCQKCGKRHKGGDTNGLFHIHHIQSFAVKEKRSDPGNLVLVCADCHRWIHSKLNVNKKFIELPPDTVKEWI